MNSNIEKKDLRSRRGRFTIYRELLFDSVGLFEPFSIISTTDIINGVEYFAVSPLFDPIPEGEKAPEYDIIQTKDKLGNVIFEAERINEH